MNQLIERKKQADDIVRILHAELDISDTKYEEAEKRYNAVAEWLARSESRIRKYSPEIYVQGSFGLGTVIKPTSLDGEYDIDAVAKLDLSAVDVSQKELKGLIGDEIKGYAISQGLKKKPKEGKRCWTIEYADASKFHMDVLPSIPNEEAFRLLLEEKGVQSDWTRHAIGITDNLMPNYAKKGVRWPVSNPKGYAGWFKSQMQPAANEIFGKSVTLMESFVHVEDVPIYRIKTPLQRVVQILKHHRDLMYGDRDDKPISIIITTLAAHAYQNEQNILDALVNIVKNMSENIDDRQGRKWIVNPVNPLENFADKWTLYPKRQIEYYRWQKALQDDIEKLMSTTGGFKRLNENLQGFAGEKLSKSVLSKYGEEMREKSKEGSLMSAKGSGILGSTGTTVKKHTFYGAKSGK